MKISIITVVRNNAENIGDCVESVLAQDWPQVEYVVVDGASNDGTLQILESYRNQIDRLISEPDSGIYNALNRGFPMRAERSSAFCTRMIFSTITGCSDELPRPCSIRYGMPAMATFSM